MYARTVGSRTLSFGVSGMLWRENLVMYDRETDSWWAQASGKAIQGELSGSSLTMMTSFMMTWKEWRARHPNTLVLSKTQSGRLRGTSDNYVRYHGAGNIGVTGRLRRAGGNIDDKARMVGFHHDGLAYAAKLDALRAGAAVVARAGDETFVVTGTQDGSGARAFRAGAHAFTVRSGRPATLVDSATGSIWNAFDGVATSGSLAGTRLEELPTTLSYWFAWRAFFPDATILK